ncbi:hypothetical protein CDAR_188021 [Caerostris darwini]|uniref:Uncharacterized protein n=1 Tax=Caerostris darwini TaxID=1538125 RepID=A0AAV4SMV5_9ARAC|nr:hypothetical protein CDAR_188021 [Caerostris darwini]
MVCGVLWQMEGDVIAFPPRIRNHVWSVVAAATRRHALSPSAAGRVARNGEHIAASKDAKGSLIEEKKESLMIHPYDLDIHFRKVRIFSL